MKKTFILLFLLISISVCAQLEYTQTSIHNEANTSILEIRIDESITQNENGGFGFKIQTPNEFTSFAIGWLSSDQSIDASTYSIIYKVHKPEKGWTDWKTTDGDINPSETKANIFLTDLLFGIDENLHDSIEFYIHPPKGANITEIYLVLQDISKSIDTKSITQTSKNGSKSCPEFPTIIPRADWCGSYTECHNPTYTVYYRTPTHTVVHHGASPDSYTDGAAIVRSYWNYHVNYNGWNDIGYNYLFDKYGNFYQGRHNPNLPNQDVHAAHAGYSNTYSIGLNFLGNSDAAETAPTAPQLQKCSEFLAWWYDYKSFDPLSSASILNQAGTEWINLPRICGHRDVNPGGTSCPGDALYLLLPDIQTQTNQIIVDCSTPSDTEAPSSEIITNRNWYNSDFETMFADADNTGGSGVRHSFYQIMDYNNTEWRANGEHGFFNDNFTTAIHSDWTDLEGTWSINSEHLLQSDEVSSNTNLYASVNQESGNSYLYHFQMKIAGSGTNKRAGMHFFCSDATQTGRENSYMVYLRADNNTVQIYKYIDNSYTTGWYITETATVNADQWYDIKIVFNTNSGLISIYQDDILIAETTDLDPFTSANSISLRTGECNVEYDDIKVYKTRSTNLTVSTSESTIDEIRYQSPTHNEEAGRIRTILIDNTENWSESYAKNIFTDFDIPQTDITNSSNWQTADFQADFNDTDALSEVEKGFYLVSADNGTQWTANQSQGFAYNDFDTEIGTDWISQVGDWSISGNSLIQTDIIESNTNIYSFLQSSLSNKYLYEFDLQIGGTDANKRGGFHYFSDDPTATNRGNGYFVWFRTSSQDLEFYKVTDDAFSLEKYYDISFNADQWYNIKVIFDRITGETLVYMDDELVGEYTDSEPYATGDYMSFRSGNAEMSVDNFRTYRSRNANANISLGSSDDITHQNQNSSTPSANIFSIVMDSAKNISTAVSQVINIDWTNPTQVATINDGTSTDIDETNDLSEISGNWSASNDTQSNIVEYSYAVGTTSGDSDFINWTNIGLTASFTNSSISLTHNQMYYLSVRAENGAGLFSTIATSDGILALNPPVIPDCPADFALCVSDDPIVLTGASPTGGMYSGNGVSAGVFNPLTAGAGEHTITYNLEGEICTFSITVNALPEITCIEDIYSATTDASFTLSGCTPVGGTYTIDGFTITSFDPSANETGDYIVTYTYINTTTNCENTCSFNIFVFEPTVLNCPENASTCIDNDEITLEGATPPGGIYSGEGVSTGIFNQITAGVGAHIITYTYDSETCQFVISVNDLPYVSCPENIFVNTSDAEFTLTGGNPEDGWYSINSIIVTTFDPTAYGEGDHTVTYYYEDPVSECINECSYIINVELYNSILINNGLFADIYPNPNNGSFFINLSQSNSDFNIEVISVNGQIVFTNNYTSAENKIKIENLSQGMYFVKVTNSYNTLVKKVVVK